MMFLTAFLHHIDEKLFFFLCGMIRMPFTPVRTVNLIFCRKFPGFRIVFGIEIDSCFRIIRSVGAKLPIHIEPGFHIGSDDTAIIVLSLIHISEPTRQAEISYAVFCLKKKKET